MKDMFGNIVRRGSVVIYNSGSGTKICLAVTVANDKCRIIPAVKSDGHEMTFTDITSNGIEVPCSSVFVTNTFLFYKTNLNTCNIVDTIQNTIIKNVNIKEEYLSCLR
ncbi:hypothetical protein Ah1_00272 [Aeromonas phage Ah1]|uniref:Uncharacterized protein n=1 Tax=Aeromonas phage Ah1 TaxID=2053701 RepID=A0A2H4YF42_9CAUD|nr:hypothetical protein KNT77_gp246 [Aeromonas phage Ah1]AUE22790.1 hypothetical protein Ah1_00272 [Aeromonas phage Ah1]UYD60154.1 hypothetical protein OPFAMLBM_00133 [Aeromonas phage avDM12-TAAL]